MSTRLTRITISLDPHVEATLRSLSDVRRTPMATIIRELLVEAQPALAESTKLLKLAFTKPREAAERMARFAEEYAGSVAQGELPMARKAGRPRKSG